MCDAQSIGVCYGQNGNNLPSAQDVVQLYKSNGIGRMRMYAPDGAALNALKGSNIELVLDVPNANLQSLSADYSAAVQWVQNNVVAYSSDVKFRYISVGNEVDPNTDAAQYVNYVLPAMQNVYKALEAANLQGQIKVSTAAYMGLIGVSYPPANGAFKDNVKSFIQPIISFLVQNNAPLLANIYPYFARIGDQSSVPLDYALFTGQPNGAYTNLFDAMLDAFYSAVESEGGSNVEIVVSESGWPSAGGADASVANAQTYYSNLINHVKGTTGTPKRPGKAIETYLFAMFDEDEKPGLRPRNILAFLLQTNSLNTSLLSIEEAQLKKSAI
ncbi:unnamed protein product [Thlaspi arvense]|uniref:glucan endo-1,3-beta-D-glucosidase n=1 Tax=Thlaspi arvense TaxID=13288 RepID=A0AAU9RJI2_THLAR|nr:unnamed protein product [Thlaspi arvense]